MGEVGGNDGAIHSKIEYSRCWRLADSLVPSEMIQKKKSICPLMSRLKVRQSFILYKHCIDNID